MILHPVSRRTAFAGVASLLLVPRLTAPGAAASGGQLLLTSTPIFADLVQNVVTEAAEVRAVVPDGADPHVYEATPADLVALTEAAAFIQMGAHLEPFIESGAWHRAVDDAGIPHLVLADHLPLITVDRVIDHGDHVHDLRSGDPHVWLDPAQTRRLIDVLEGFTSEVLPMARSTIAANSRRYRDEVATLEHEMDAGLAAIPLERRRLVVFHDAFTYFAARFGFEITGVVLPNPDGEPNARDLTRLVETIRREHVPVIFTEPQFDQSLVERIAAEAGVAVGELLTDTFAGRVTSYLELMRFNLDSLVHHLGPT